MNSKERLHALDAVRAFALLAGVVLHAAMGFLPGFGAVGWPLADNSPSAVLGVTFYVIHMFRMTTFFVIAGFFGHLLFHRLGARAFIQNRAIRIVVPLVVGWMVIFPSIVLAFYWATTTSTTASRVLATSPPQAPGLLAFPLTHLWFLYVLVLVYSAMLLGRAIFVRAIDPSGSVRARIDSVVGALVRGPVAVVVMAAPLAFALVKTPAWAQWFGIPTPDQSLIPNAAAAVGFGTAFLFGWLVQRQMDLLKVWERRWAIHLAIALVMTAASLSIIGLSPVFAPVGWGQTSGWGQTFRFALDHSTPIYALCYTLATWSWTFAIIGIALRFFNQSSPSVRYVADASYWIYLVHLPLVFFLQAAVKDLPWHWTVKFPLLMAVALGLLFASYHWLVRYTFVGEVLNGRSTTRSGTTVTAGGALAKLTNARKRFEKTQALDGLSLDVMPGELLAVLGPNGAGKSTAISLLLGLQEPDEGTATLFGQSPSQVEARFRVGVMMQEVALSAELRVREHIDLACSYYPSPMTADEAMALTHTTALADRPYGKLSAGQKRQVQFAVAICGRPALLFLDEPTVGLDIQAREMLWATLRQLVAQGSSIVLTTHYLEEAEALADRVAVLAHGRLIASGSVDAIRAVVSRKFIRCVTSLAADQIRAWPNVVTVTGDGDHLQVVATDADEVVRRLIAADPNAHDLEVRRAGLAEAFTELTQEAA